jgi:hypothetical protein
MGLLIDRQQLEEKSMRLLFAGIVAMIATGAHAEGFSTRDLSGIAADVVAALGSGFIHRAEPSRLTLTCPECAGAPMIDVLLGRQTDGTEQRVRSGETSIASMEKLCQAKSPACRLSALDIAPAVGWISTYPMGSNAGYTAIILRDGDLLTIRSLASSAEIARDNAETVLKAVKPKLIGN